MQQLAQRNTYTPTDAPQVRCNCDLGLNKDEGGPGDLGLKTCGNNPDVDITFEHRGGNLRVFHVYVLSCRGNPIMPCNPRKAKILLKQGKAKVINLRPFTIQLMVYGGETTQDLTVGVDSGYQNVGLSVVSAKKEVYSSTVELRRDIVELLSEKRMYRRNRRNRKTWYKKPRFLNRKTGKCWLAPSIRHKFDSHIRIIDSIHRILPINKIVVEVASFDIQAIKNPNIDGIGYQQGNQYGFGNVREYVFHRDGHKCNHCGKSNTPLQVHHIESRKTGGDRPENLVTLCIKCHENHHKGKINLKLKKLNGFRPETFMSMVRWKLVEKLKQKYSNIDHTYGFLTKQKRISNELEKSHISDAFCIANGNIEGTRNAVYSIFQKRKNNRSLQLNKKGQKPSIRRTRYPIQPKDKILVNGKWYVVKGMFNLGKWVRVVNPSGKDLNFKVDSVTKVFHERSFVTNLVN
ncbi:MAG: HNH endonuclease [Oligoflexales bacterium]|nr:HNH endonuclease [Oligoflexales bacterium]